MVGDLWKVVVVTAENGDVSEDCHYFMTKAQADAFFSVSNKGLSYALPPVKIR
jgi:hypothetical protein